MARDFIENWKFAICNSKTIINNDDENNNEKKDQILNDMIIITIMMIMSIRTNMITARTN